MPYAPQRIYLDYTRDIIYLGPDFSPHFLHEFLVSPVYQKFWIYFDWLWLQLAIVGVRSLGKEIWTRIGQDIGFTSEHPYA
ncbi:hypothetical protein M7I_6631 [Glarea lozoyensis 74030]|uniref:Uncharacterized protein n=1 Tax=Glarea lozoyensis (strain ATCC 74030 / MF5533) TaxID=1104152 RepID=H0EV38_GLAL7|nr:hypothetical protein M7I_6631 [Glarea lozoyensis 74030]